MANPENLKPPFTPSEARIQGRKGGIASGEARRKRKAFAEIAQRVVSSELSGGNRKAVEATTGPLEDDEATLYAAAVAQCAAKAANGDLKAMRELQNIVEHIDRMNGGAARQDVAEDAFSAAMREMGGNL